jgi:hypothetical protein
MITLTSDKHALIEAGFSIRDPVQQGLGQSTPHHVSRLGGFTPTRKAFSHRATHCSMTGHDGTYQEALYPRLLATVRRTV